jgi:hypothetical protein
MRSILRVQFEDEFFSLVEKNKNEILYSRVDQFENDYSERDLQKNVAKLELSRKIKFDNRRRDSFNFSMI